MYTEIVFGVELKKDTPSDIIDILKYMLGGVEDNPAVPPHPQHELFDTDRWHFMLCCESYYFDGITHSELAFDDISDSYYLTVRSNLKNYCQEIEKFMDFIQPYLETRGFIGYTMYEEDGDPTLIYNTREGIKYERHSNRDCTYYW
jgi:hypothetical protein